MKYIEIFFQLEARSLSKNNGGGGKKSIRIRKTEKVPPRRIGSIRNLEGSRISERFAHFPQCYPFLPRSSVPWPSTRKFRFTLNASLIPLLDVQKRGARDSSRGNSATTTPSTVARSFGSREKNITGRERKKEEKKSSILDNFPSSGENFYADSRLSRSSELHRRRHPRVRFRR